MKQFKITSGAIIASDPCYHSPKWCQGVLPNVRNGTWYAQIGKSQKGMGAGRNSYLLIYHEDCITTLPHILRGKHYAMPKLPIVAGVDSGQFGFFDVHAYRNDSVITDDIPLWDYECKKSGDKFYAACANLTHTTAEKWGVLPFGVVSSSGWGDGAYDVLGEKNSYGQYIALVVIFIDEDEYDYDDYDDDDYDDDDYDDDE